MDACRGKKKNSLLFLSFLRSRSQLNNQRGQFAIEAVLLTALLVGTFVAVTGVIKEKKMITKLFGAPVKSLKNMTAFGTFRESCEGLGINKRKQTLSQCHPNSITRALSSKPE